VLSCRIGISSPAEKGIVLCFAVPDPCKAENIVDHDEFLKFINK